MIAYNMMVTFATKIIPANLLGSLWPYALCVHCFRSQDCRIVGPVPAMDKLNGGNHHAHKITTIIILAQDQLPLKQIRFANLSMSLRW